MLSKDHAMISIRPDYVDRIIAGTKTIELRRRFMELPIGSTLWIYSTLPVGAIVAVATLDLIDRDHPNELWRKYRRDIGIMGKQFETYFDGCHLGAAIKLTNVRTVKPLPLQTIRTIRGVQQMPQVAVRVSQREARSFSERSSAALA